MRMPAFALVADVCWVCMPVLSDNNILISPGLMVASSCTSSSAITSTLVGVFFTLLPERVLVTVTSSSVAAAVFKNICIVSKLFKGKVNGCSVSS